MITEQNLKLQTLKQVVKELDFSDKPLLIYVHKLDHQNAQKIVSKILQNAEFAKMIVTPAHPERQLPLDRDAGDE